MLGLLEGLDYLDPKNCNKLRYDALMIAADSDVDGKHFTDLILNFFHCRFSSLLARGFVCTIALQSFISLSIVMIGHLEIFL